MSDLVLAKNWRGKDLLELNVSAESTFVAVHQLCYIQDTDLRRIGEEIVAYASDPNQKCYVEFGKKTGNFTPAFSLSLSEADHFGHVTIELDMEIDDNPDRRHRCQFYIDSELGAVERFGRNLILWPENENEKIALNGVDQS